MKEKEDPSRDEMNGSEDLFKETRVISNYIIPLTVFLVVAVFVFLILVMGFMDLRRLDRTLVEFMENRGLDIVATIENVAQEDLEFLRRALKEERPEPGFEPPPTSGKEHLIQERLLSALFEVARNIDSQWQRDDISEEELKNIAYREKLSLIVLLDESGRIYMQSREFEQASLEVPGLTMGDHERLAMELMNILGPLAEMGLIALTRRDGSGTTVIALDSGKMKYWGAKTALKRFVGDLGWEHELAWLTIADLDGNIIGRVGDEPDGRVIKAELLTQDIHSAHRRVLSGKHEREGSHFLEVLAPLRLDNDVIGYARMGLKWDRPREILSENRNRMIITTILIVLIGTLSTVGLYRNQSRQLARMEEMKKRLNRAEHLSALGRLAAGVAHEIRNPLNAISIATQRLQREYFPSDEGDRGDFQRISGIIRDEIRRLNGIIEEFVTFFRIRRMELRPFSLEEVVRKILAVMEAELEARNITVRTSLNGDAGQVPMDPDKLTQAIQNIMKNAMEAITGAGTITLKINPAEGNRVNLSITDTGTGLTPEELERIFNPEYTTKEKGLGLGLMLAHEIIEGHRGEIHVISTKGTGTTFEIILPAGRPPDTEPEGASS